MKSRISKAVLAATFAAAVGLAGASAFAQPGPHGAGHGPGMQGDVVEAIARLKGQLNLNTSQQGQWDAAAAASKAARDAARANMAKVHDALTAELAKTEPDLAAVATVADSVRAAAQAQHKQARDSWLALYATFTPEQKGVVRTALQNRVARMETFRQKMLERRGG